MGKVKYFFYPLIFILIVSCENKDEIFKCVCCEYPKNEYNLDSTLTKWFLKMPFEKDNENDQNFKAYSSKGLSEYYRIKYSYWFREKRSGTEQSSCYNNNVYSKYVEYSSSLYQYNFWIGLSFQDGYNSDVFKNAKLNSEKLRFELNLNFNKKSPPFLNDAYSLDFSVLDSFKVDSVYNNFIYKGVKQIGSKVFNDIFQLNLNYGSSNDYLKIVYLDKYFGIVGFTFNDGSEWYIDYP